MNELEMSKKRYKKVYITDAAIAKVPLINYKEIPEKEYAVLHELAKEVLTVAKNENDSNEVAITYSLESEKLIAEGREYVGVALGDEHSVDPCANTVSNHLVMASLECVVIVLHNHPSLSKFSLEDIQFFLQNRTVKMMIVVTNLGSISYLVKKNTYDRNIAVKIYNDAVSMHNQGSNLRDYQKAVNYFLSGCHEANIIYENQ